jgi:hypothetical protein
MRVSPGEVADQDKAGALLGSPAFLLRVEPDRPPGPSHTGRVLGLDYSGGRPPAQAIRSAGYGFAMRYLDNGLGGSRANLTGPECSTLRAAGIDVALVWERKLLVGPDRATQGAPAGTADARAAQAQAVDVGLPDNPIYFCVDFDIPDYAPGNADPRAKLGPVGDYLAAARDVVGQARMGVYGGYWAVSRALDAGLAEWAWQTLAWSGGKVDSRINLLQRLGIVTVGGIDCDVNEARTAEFGQHPVEGIMTKDEIEAILKYPIPRENVPELPGATSLWAVAAWFDSAVSSVRGTTTSAVDALRAEMEAKLAALAVPEIDYDRLGASIAKNLHATIEVEGAQPAQ